ncbi:MAG: hypothetical protein EZS28_021057, partial [Streblomastix strix]
MRFLIIVLLFVVSNLAQNVSDNAEAKRKTFGQEKYKKKDGFVNVAHSIHGAIRNATSGKKFWKYEMSRSISEMVDKLTNGSGDIIVLKNNLTSPQVIGWGIGIVFSFVISIAVYIILMVYFCGWCCAQCCQDLCCKSQGPVCSLCCWDDKKGTKTFCKICTLVTYVIFSLILLLFVAVMIYGSFIVTKPLDEIKEGLVSINAMANEFIDFAQESVSIEDNLDQTFKEEDTTKSLIRPILVTLHYFQDILSNHTSGQELFRSLDVMGAEQGDLQIQRDGMLNGHAILVWISQDDPPLPVTQRYNEVFLKDFENSFVTLNPYQILPANIPKVKDLLSESLITFECSNLIATSNCTQKPPEIERKQTKVNWFKEYMIALNSAFLNSTLENLLTNAQTVYSKTINFNEDIAKVKNINDLKIKVNQFESNVTTLKNSGVSTRLIQLKDLLETTVTKQQEMIKILNNEIPSSSATTITLTSEATDSIKQYILKRDDLLDALDLIYSQGFILGNISKAGSDFTSLANQIISSKQAADDSVKLVDDQINKA